MAVMTFEEFVSFYEKYGKTINQVSYPKSKLNENQLKRKYEKYLKTQKNKKNKFKIDTRLKEVYSIVDERDSYSCRLLGKLSMEEYRYIFYTEQNYFLQPIDHAHVFPRSTHGYLKYDVDNIVLLSRLFHSRLDQFLDPVTGEQIGKDIAQQWWQVILGTEQYIRLIEKLK